MKYVKITFHDGGNLSIPINKFGLDFLSENYGFKTFIHSGEDILKDIENWMSYFSTGWSTVSIHEDSAPYSEDLKPNLD